MVNCMQALTKREERWMRDTRKIVFVHVATLDLFGAIAVTSRNYFVREMLVFFAAFATLLVAFFLIAGLCILFGEAWKHGSSWVRGGVEKAASAVNSVGWRRPIPHSPSRHYTVRGAKILRQDSASPDSSLRPALTGATGAKSSMR